MTAQSSETNAQRLARAERLMADKAYEPAHALCMEALSADPGAARAWFLLGVLAADHDNPGKAAELFARAAALDLDDPRAPAQLARCLIALNRRDEALTQAQAAAGRGPATTSRPCARRRQPWRSSRRTCTRRACRRPRRSC